MKILIGFGCLIAFFLLWGLVDTICRIINRNRKRIGLPVPECRMLAKGDSVSFGRRVYEFNQLGKRSDALKSPEFPVESLRPGERILEFRQVDSKENLYLPESAMKDCRYICNKRGVKWALTEDDAAAGAERAKYFYE